MEAIVKQHWLAPSAGSSAPSTITASNIVTTTLCLLDLFVHMMASHKRQLIYKTLTRLNYAPVSDEVQRK